MAAFNTKHNHLPTPFRIRCGVSSGTVAIVDGTPIGHLQSAVIDRAANLQKSAQPGGIEIDSAINV
jgi:class 3 adenylate cyclase